MPSRSTRKDAQAHDRHLCRARHRIKHFFARLKPYRAIAWTPTPRSVAAALCAKRVKHLR